MRGAVTRIVTAMSSARAVAGAVLLVLVWAALGPPLHYSSGWQLSINTTTTIITFLVGFMILYTQSKESKATQVKLDAIIEALESTDNRIVGLEDQAESVIDEVRAEVRDAANPG